MGGENQDTERASKEVTAVVNIKIKPGCEKSYDEWLDAFWYQYGNPLGFCRNLHVWMKVNVTPLTPHPNDPELHAHQATDYPQA